MDGNEKINSDGRQACYIVLVPTSTGTRYLCSGNHLLLYNTTVSHHVNKKLQVHTSYQYKYNELCMMDRRSTTQQQQQLKYSTALVTFTKAYPIDKYNQRYIKTNY